MGVISDIKDRLQENSVNAIVKNTAAAVKTLDAELSKLGIVADPESPEGNRMSEKSKHEMEEKLMYAYEVKKAKESTKIDEAVGYEYTDSGVVIDEIKKYKDWGARIKNVIQKQFGALTAASKRIESLCSENQKLLKNEHEERRAAVLKRNQEALEKLKIRSDGLMEDVSEILQRTIDRLAEMEG